MAAKKTTKKTTKKAAPPKAASKAADLIEPGRTAPAFTLTDQAGRTHKLADYRGRWVVLYFYPKDDTSGCTRQACDFRDALPRFKKADAVVLGISPDDENSHRRFADKHQLPFTLLADVGSSTCAKYGVWQEKSMYGRKYMGVVRTTYLINPNGKVAHRWDKVKVPDHIKEVQNVLAQQSG